ncbi:hypothetical protein MD484_g4865, partial [Candolleomyces efflorescens]
MDVLHDDIIIRRTIAYMHASAITFYVCDYADTLEDEVTLMWPRRWGPSKILYTLGRYSLMALLVVGATIELPAGAPFSQKLCAGMDAVYNIAGVVVIYSATGKLTVWKASTPR